MWRNVGPINEWGLNSSDWRDYCNHSIFLSGSRIRYPWILWGLPLTQGKNNAIWVIVDRLTKTTHFMAMRNTGTLDQLARAYLKEVVRLHGVPNSIVSDRDTRFQSGFWRKLPEAFRTLLRFSTTFHPAIDGQTDRTIQTLEDMLRTWAWTSRMHRTNRWH